jgi:nitroreductase
MLERYQRKKFNENKQLLKSYELLDEFKTRRTIRHFSQESFDKQIICNAIQIAGLAPNGANKQPWAFSLISDPRLKKKIREKAEEVEFEFYQIRRPKKWIKDLSALHTNENKKFLTDAPYLLPIFSKSYERDGDNNNPNYYVRESVGIATGFLIASLHQCGLSVLTYTPSKIRFLHDILDRPKNEKLFMLLAIGLPHPLAEVPIITKKSVEEILTIHTPGLVS